MGGIGEKKRGSFLLRGVFIFRFVLVIKQKVSEQVEESHKVRQSQSGEIFWAKVLFGHNR